MFVKNYLIILVVNNLAYGKEKSLVMLFKYMSRCLMTQVNRGLELRKISAV